LHLSYGETYGSILGSFRSAALKSLSVALVLETLWCDETLDLGCLYVELAEEYTQGMWNASTLV
jgi:hypothetical protein